MAQPRIVVNECLWVVGGATTQAVQYPRLEMKALNERGAKTLVYDGNAKAVEELGQILKQSDAHIILIWMRPNELKSLIPLLKDRKNFSIVLDDWWLCPHWFTRHATYIIDRMYCGIAVALGQSDMVTYPPPIFLWPDDNPSKYGNQAAVLRIPTLFLWPFIDIAKWFQRREEPARADRLLYLPFSVEPKNLQLENEPLKYDFCLTGNTISIWLMRDPYASFRYSFANLYHDRKRIMDRISEFDGKPYSIYDWRKLSPAIPPRSWEDYTRITRQSRFVLSTGGFHNAALPKHLEYACLGTPMIGRTTVFEFPWLDDCMVDVDEASLSGESMKPVLDEALARYPQLRENCLKWREKLFKLHDIHRLLDMLQAQINGQPIPPEYLKKARTANGSNGSTARH